MNSLMGIILLVLGVTLTFSAQSETTQSQKIQDALLKFQNMKAAEPQPPQTREPASEKSFKKLNQLKKTQPRDGQSDTQKPSAPVPDKEKGKIPDPQNLEAQPNDSVVEPVSEVQDDLYFSGDWGGYRSWLSENGLDIELVYKADWVANTQGGVRRNEGFLHNVDLAIQIDNEKLWG